MNIGIRAIFNWVSKVIWDCISFASLCPVIGLENLHLYFNQSDTELTSHGLDAYILPCFKEFGGFFFKFSEIL